MLKKTLVVAAMVVPVLLAGCGGDTYSGSGSIGESSVGHSH